MRCSVRRRRSKTFIVAGKSAQERKTRWRMARDEAPIRGGFAERFQFMSLSDQSTNHEQGRRARHGFTRAAISILTIVVTVALFAGCQKKPAPPPGGGFGGGGPMEVGVLTIAPTPVTLTQDLPGRISAFRMAEVRARVNGIVLKRLFTEGSDVTEGQALYEIDPAPYQATFDSAEAALARAEANVVVAKLKEERSRQLLATKAISKQEYDDAFASLRTYEADVLAGKASVQSARINLEYTKVTSPVAGRIGISQVTEGAYVQAGACLLYTSPSPRDS